jgi:hypothetical protein
MAASGGITMYEKPRVERLGTFRELTKQGYNGANDGMTFAGTNGDNCQDFDVVNGMTTMTCIVGGASARG